MKWRCVMINIDIVGDLREELDEVLNKSDFELFIINQITQPEDFQEVLVVYPPPKKKFRWKAYTEEEAEILFEYVEQAGGILVLIPPFNSEYLEKTIEIYERFQISPVLCRENTY
jgi:vacuolar-type H+-ATPase subunit E/Vma4